MDSVPSISRVKPNEKLPIVSKDFSAKAPFLVWARVDSWQETSSNSPVKSIQDLEKLVESSAKAAGIDMSKPFPFRVEGEATGAYHILNGGKDIPHGHGSHKRIQTKYELNKIEVNTIGFWSNKHHGVFTHRGSNIHVHVVSKDGKHAGHLDEVSFPGQLKIFLPATPKPK